MNSIYTTYFVILALLYSHGLFSQDSTFMAKQHLLVEELYQANLVPNSDFHSFKACPEKYTIVPKSYFVDDWTMPTGGTPDYFNVCSYEAGVPSNWVGHVHPRKGYGYVGLIAGRYTNNYGKVVEVREYVQAKLRQPLEADQTYYVRFFVSLAGYSQFALDGMGISFSDSLIDVTNFIARLPLEEHVGNPSYHFLDKKGNWMRIEGYYTAKGTENFIVIGNFKSDAETNEKNTFGRSDLNCSYYLVDDVLVAKVSPAFLAEYVMTPVVDSLTQDELEQPIPEFKPILFDFNKADIGKSFKTTILDLADYMNLYPEVQVSLIGHTDSIGEDGYNLELSTLRAKEVARLLATKDIKMDRLKIKGKGESEPLNDNKNEEQRALNRRVEIKVH